MLVGRDRETKMTVSHVVPVKGGDQEWVAEKLTRDILKLELHGDLTLWSDQEPEIVDLLKLRGVGKNFLVQSPVGDSKANVVAERAVQSVEKMVRVHKLAFDTRIGARLPVRHPLFAWLFEQLSDIMNRFLVGRDEKPLIKQRKRNVANSMSWSLGPPLCFVCGKVEGACMSEKWYSGFWLGKRTGTEEHVVVKEYGALVRARAVRELERNVTLSDSDHLRGQPHDPTGTIRGVQRDAGRRVEEGEREGAHQQDDRFLPRRVFITHEVVRKFGPTPDCRKSRGAMAGDKAYQFVNRSEGGRRMEALMKEDDAFGGRVHNAEQRQTEGSAEIVERRAKAQDDKDKLREDHMNRKKRRLKVIEQALMEMKFVPTQR